MKKNNKLWQKNWELDSIVEAFETKGDLLMDQKLIPYDVIGSIAHAKMLYKIKILTKEELLMLEEGLQKIKYLYEKGRFVLGFGDEDCHTKIEKYLTDEYGDVGKKIHTGRSRNDQVLAVLRLYSKDQLLQIWEEIIALVQCFLEFAQLYEFLAMPGFTHMQKAMPSSIGMWAGSFVESLMDDLEVLKTAFKLNDQSPLGSAAGYGVPIDLDRQYSAGLLGFEKVQSNSLYCQNSRGKIESAIISSLVNILLTLNKFATDLLLFTTSEFDYFKVDHTLCTGSSIMPQKKNVDVAELIQSKVHLVLGNYVQIISLSSNLISGYNRDLQDTKKPLIESLEITNQTLKITKFLAGSIYPKKDNIKKSLTPELFATHKVFDLVKQGVPFRKAYRTVANSPYSDPGKDIKSILKMSSHIGGTGNLGLENHELNLRNEKNMLMKEKREWENTLKKLVKGGENI